MKNLKIGLMAGLAALAMVAWFPATAQTTLGDSPGVFCLVSSNTITNDNTASATFTNKGGYFGNAYLMIMATNSYGTSPTLTCTLQSSTDQTTWTTLSPNVAVTTNYPTTGNGAIAIGLVGPIQNYTYLRTTNVLGGTTPSYNYSLSLIMPRQYR
jgi:hypothetical protein